MAVTYRGITVTGVSDNTSTNITLPTGTIEGDILLLILDWGGHQNETFSMSGFTAVFENTQSFPRPNTSYYKHSYGYKEATSGDISAGYITVSSSATYGSNCIGTLISVAGGDISGMQYAKHNPGYSTSPSYSTTITPTDVNSLLLLHIFASAYLGAPSISNEAITTSNPSWTEVNEYNGSGSDGTASIATAWAVRPEITATGNSSCNLSASRDSNGLFIVIPRKITVPVATTQAVSSIDLTTATGNGDITSDGEATITERGVVWGTSPSPTTSGFKSIASGTTGAFTAPITGLTNNTLYYVRAYATNAIGTAYGSDVTFTTLPIDDDKVVKDIGGVDGQIYAVSVDIGGTTGTLTLQLGSTGASQTYAAGAGTVVLEGIYGGLSGLIFTASATFDGYIDNVMWVLVLGSTVIDWDLDTLTNVYPINSSVVFKRVEDKEFDRFRIYRYLDIQFKDLDAYVTVLLKKEANEDLENSTKEFLVSNVSGETLPFINKRVSMLLKGQAMRVGLSNNRLNETFTVCQFVLRGMQQPRKLFDKSKIINV